MELSPYKLSIVAAVVALSLMGLIAGLLQHDTQQLITVLGFLAPTVIALLGLVKTESNAQSLDETHSKLDQISAQHNEDAKL